MKKIILLSSILIILLLGISNVSAFDDSDNVTADFVGEKTFDAIQNAIDKSNASDVILLEGTYMGSGAPIKISKSVSIKGTGNGATLNAKSNSQIFTISADNVLIENVRFINGQANNRIEPNSGGAIDSSGDNLKIINCEFTTNSAQYAGALLSQGNNASIIDCTFDANTVEYGGGALYVDGDDSLVDNCIFLDNMGYHVGAAVVWAGSNGILSNSLFVNPVSDANRISQFGGAVLWMGSNGILTKSSFFNNVAKNNGAAVYWKGINGSLTYCIFGNNTSPNDLAYWGNPDYLKNNFWGMNLYSAEDVISHRLIYCEGSFVPPSNWVNLNLINSSSIGFVLNDGSELEDFMPDYSVKLTNDVKNNTITPLSSKITENTIGFIYNSTVSEVDTIKLTNAYGLDEEFAIYGDSIVVSRTGNDTKDLENAISKATDGSTIFLGKNACYHIKDLNIDRNVALIGVNVTIILENTSKLVFNVSKTNPRKSSVISASNMVVYRLEKSKYLKAVLKDNDDNLLASKSLQIIVNGKIYNRTTDSNGSVSVLLTSLVSGKYSIVVYLMGDDEYDSSIAVCNLTVKKQKPTLTIQTKTLKVKTKNKVVKVLFKDQFKKPQSKKTLKLTINKKTYTAKTNSKGVASFKVTLKAKKSYDCTVKFAGDKNYFSVSKSTKIRVK